MDPLHAIEPNRRPGLLPGEAALPNGDKPHSGSQDATEIQVQVSREQVGPRPAPLDPRKRGDEGNVRRACNSLGNTSSIVSTSDTGNTDQPVLVSGHAARDADGAAAFAAETAESAASADTPFSTRVRGAAQRNAVQVATDEAGSHPDDPANAQEYSRNTIDATLRQAHYERLQADALKRSDPRGHHPASVRSGGRRKGLLQCDEIGGPPSGEEDDEFDASHRAIDDGEERAHHLAMSAAVPPPLLPPTLAASGSLTALGKAKLRADRGRRPRAGRSADRFDLSGTGKLDV